MTKILTFVGPDRNQVQNEARQVVGTIIHEGWIDGFRHIGYPSMVGAPSSETRLRHYLSDGGNIYIVIKGD